MIGKVAIERFYQEKTNVPYPKLLEPRLLFRFLQTNSEKTHEISMKGESYFDLGIS